VNSLVCLSSISKPKNPALYITTFGLMTVQGLWFYVIALTYKGLVLTAHTTTPAFALVNMVVWGCLLAGSAWGRDKDTVTSIGWREYRKVNNNPGGEDGII